MRYELTAPAERDLEDIFFAVKERHGELLSPAKTLLDPATDFVHRPFAVPSLPSLGDGNALGELGAQLIALRSEELFSRIQETQGLGDDLNDRLEAAGRDLGSQEHLDFLRQRHQAHERQYTRTNGHGRLWQPLRQVIFWIGVPR